MTGPHRRFSPKCGGLSILRTLVMVRVAARLSVGNGLRAVPNSPRNATEGVPYRWTLQLYWGFSFTPESPGPMSASSSPATGPDFSRGDGLLPAIAQDAATGEVLMMAYMNAESYAETLATGRAVYLQPQPQEALAQGRRKRQRAAGPGDLSSIATPTRSCSRSSRSAAPPATKATRVASSARSRPRA